MAVENRQPEQGGGEGSGAGAIYEVWKKSAVKGTHVRGVEKKGKSSMTKPKPKPKSSKTPFTKKVIRTTDVLDLMAFGRTGGIGEIGGIGGIGEIGGLKLKRKKGFRLDGVRAEKLG